MELTAGMIEWVSHYGYIALFVSCVVGLFIFPVPNEVLLMTGGWLVTATYLDILPAFIVIYSAVLVHGTIWYIIGTRMDRFSHKSKRISGKWKHTVEHSREIINQKGIKALTISYFIPFIRHAVPLGIGASSISYGRFAIYGFTSAAVWVTLYFSIGYFFGQAIGQIQNILETLSYVVVAAVFLIGVYCLRKYRKGVSEPDKAIN